MLLQLSEITTSIDLTIAGNLRWCYLQEDNNGRSIWFSRLSDVQLAGEAAIYPDVTLHSSFDHKFYAPIKEKTMSLLGLAEVAPRRLIHEASRTHARPVFFFIYNTDNYYHFIYDTLPYLISFLELRKEIPMLQLLMSYPNSQSQTFYKFVTEFLELFGIEQSEVVLSDMRTSYSTMYLSSSYTHDHDSNAEPRSEIYEHYQKLVRANTPRFSGKGPRRIYISRRTWLHGDYSNIGTDYTSRRRLVNEDAVVDLLVSYGFTEVFTENLATMDKLDLFSHAEIVVGALGGGVCNVLFSPTRTKLLCLASPVFLDVNSRFAHSLSKVQLTWFNNASHVELGKFKRFMRISCPSRGIVGEVTEVLADSLTVAYTNESVAGWNAQNKFATVNIPMSDCVPIDAGLNSAWRIDVALLELALRSIL